MQKLRAAVEKTGRVLSGGILKVDGFINHQVDPEIMEECGAEFARRFAGVGATKVLTAEISGIAPALMAAWHLHIPVVYARKTKPVTMPEMIYLTTAPSHTKGHMVELMISPEYLRPGERVLIIDDFLASGATILALVRLAQAAGSSIVGVGALIEKTFEGGRDALAPLGVPVESLVRIASLDGGVVHFAD